MNLYQRISSFVKYGDTYPQELYERELAQHKENLTDEVIKKHLEDPSHVFDYQPVNTSVRIPGRRQNIAVQMISDYYLYRMERYYECDGIIFRSINKLVEMIMQSGFIMEAENPEDIKKLMVEIKAILRRSPIKIWEAFERRQAHDVVLYGNSFLHKKTPDRSEIKIQSIWNKDPIQMSVVMNKDRETLMYYASKDALRKRGDIEKQIRGTTAGRFTSKLRRIVPGVFYVPENRQYDKRFKLSEICHIKYLEMAQNAISIPPLYPILNDILSLRSIEDDMVLLSYQYGHPILHATIERENRTDEQIRAESIRLRNQIQKMEGNGMITTSDGVDIQLKGPQGNFPNLVEFHQLFRQRIEKGGGVPDIFIGEGGGVGRQTSEVVAMSFSAYVNDLGKATAVGLQELIDDIWIRNILKKDPSTFVDQVPVTIRFREADRIEKRSEEQHAISLWQANAITHGELRSRIGGQVDAKHRDKYFTELQSDLEPEPPPAASGSNASGTTGANARKVRSQTQPRNQHGTPARQGTKKN